VIQERVVEGRDAAGGAFKKKVEKGKPRKKFEPIELDGGEEEERYGAIVSPLQGEEEGVFSSPLWGKERKSFYGVGGA